MNDQSDNIRLYMIAIVNANHEEILNIIEREQIAGLSFTLSTANILFESLESIDSIIEIFKGYDVLYGLNFIIVDITNSCDTNNMYLKLNQKANSKLKELMEFVLKFFDPEDLKNKIQESNSVSKTNIDRILEKINRNGINSLSKKEQKLLEDFSKQ